ncbi:hypothetical protein [Bosea sp. AS-1]|uniref:hypothetical protein n=1 Tax=Bosea sp. AS-1 TaxID=2015316 RepID=UPI0020BFC868|nr:hypothetical protein [Bosea sp. AS-1]
MIRMTDAKVVAGELHARYDHARAVTLMARTMQKALFGGRQDEVVFWALVYAHYCGGELSPPSMGSSIPCLSSCVIRPDSAESGKIPAYAPCGSVLMARFSSVVSDAARCLDHASRFIGLSLILSYGQLNGSKAAKERWVGWRA